MCQEMNVTDFQNVRAVNMTKKTVTKEKLCGWLETVCCILDTFSVPLLSSAVPLAKRVEKLKDEKICDQKSIIDLQKKVIEISQEGLKAVQTTVQTEMKSYSSVLSNNYAAALAPRKIQAAVRKVVDREDRSRNVIIYGVSETSGEVLQKRVEEVLVEIGEKPAVKDCCRVGVERVGVSRPIKLSLRSHDHVAQVLRNAKQLRTKEGYRSIYICPDRTAEERKAYKKLVEEVIAKRKAEPNKVHRIKNNKIVSSDKDTEPAVEPGTS